MRRSVAEAATRGGAIVTPWPAWPATAIRRRPPVTGGR